MLRETLKQEIDGFNDSQLSRLAEFVASVKLHAQQLVKTVPLWQRATPAERSLDFREWVAGLPAENISLSDEAFDRESIYE